MAKSISALINPDVLGWARLFMGFEIDYVADMSGLDATQLKQWEAGKAHPTITQLRKLAKVYDFSIAIFYLPKPPTIKSHRPKDRRFLAGFEYAISSPEINREFRRAEDRREIALELLQNIERYPKLFQAKASLEDGPDQLAERMRRLMSVSYDEQCRWRDPRSAFNSWREKIESHDVLVFQSTDVPLREMRGYSMFFEVLPLVCVNRKDSYNARSFTLLHEVVHLMLKTESICDIDDSHTGLNRHDRQIEVFCNNVAACVLVPTKYFLQEDKLESASRRSDEGEKAIKELAKTYSVSREVIVRRMHSLQLVDDAFYQAKRAQYNREYLPQRSGFVPPIVKVLNTIGRPLVGLALENLNRGAITTADFSEFMGIKIKHLDGLRARFLLA
jgi:Zn-dependent peptidase ImmA (M78 family)